MSIYSLASVLVLLVDITGIIGAGGTDSHEAGICFNNIIKYILLLFPSLRQIRLPIKIEHNPS